VWEKLLDNGGGVDRKTMIVMFRKQMQRKAIDKEVQFDDDPDATHGKSKLNRPRHVKKSHQVVKTTRTSEGPNG
jgi:hypothetical protein